MFPHHPKINLVKYLIKQYSEIQNLNTFFQKDDMGPSFNNIPQIALPNVLMTWIICMFKYSYKLPETSKNAAVTKMIFILTTSLTTKRKEKELASVSKRLRSLILATGRPGSSFSNHLLLRKLLAISSPA